MLLQLLVNGLAAGCVLAVMATGFALIYNTTRIFHIAHGATYTIAAYLCFYFLIRLHWPLVFAVGTALVLTAALGVLMEVAVYAPLEQRKAASSVALLSSIGLYIALVNLIAMLFGNETQVLLPGIEATLRIGPVILTQIQAAQLEVGSGVLILTLLTLRFSRLGMIIRAMRDYPSLTMVMGVDGGRVRRLVFALGSALAGAAAILTALDVGIDPNVGMPALLIASVALIIGGVGNFYGAMLGGFLIGLLQGLVIWKFSARWTDALTFALLILFLLFRPQGLIGRRLRVEETVS